MYKTKHSLITFCSPLSSHKYEPRGLARQKGILKLLHALASQTSGDTQIVFGDLAFWQTNQSWQSPGSCRASQRSMISGNRERRYWRREHYGEGPTTCQDAQKYLEFSSKKLCSYQKKGSSFAHCIHLFKKKRLQIGVCTEEIDHKRRSSRGGVGEG